MALLHHHVVSIQPAPAHAETTPHRCGRSYHQHSWKSQLAPADKHILRGGAVLDVHPRGVQQAVPLALMPGLHLRQVDLVCGSEEEGLG